MLVGVVRDAVREAEVVNVADVAIFRCSASLHHTVDDTFVLEECVNTDVLRVTEENFTVLGGPGDARSFTPPTDVAPEINTSLNTSFFAFVTFYLNACNIFNTDRQTNKQKQCIDKHTHIFT